MNKDELERLAALQIRGLNQARNSSEVLFLLMKLVEAARILDARTLTVTDDVRKNVMDEINSRLQNLEAKINNALQNLENKISNITNNSLSNVTHIHTGSNGSAECGIKITDPDNLGEGFVFFTGKDCEFQLIGKKTCSGKQGDSNG